jgi:ABC-type phosphate/phosphonate transport system substrate-binding protein
MGRFICLVAMTAALVTLGTLPPGLSAPANPTLPNGTVRIGLVGTLFRDTPEPMVQLMIRPFKSLLESQTGVTGEVITCGDADCLGRQLKQDQVQLGVFHGVELAWARKKVPELKPLLIAVNEQPFLRAVLVVRKDSTVASPADLNGKPIALPRLSREHCRLFLERRCAHRCCKAGIAAREVTMPCDVEDALDEVVESQVAGAVVDAVALEGYSRLKPGRSAKLRTVQQSETFPCAVVAYVPGVLPEPLLERFRDGMIGAKESARGKQLLDLCRITRFEAPPADYEQLLAEIVRAYPPPPAPAPEK